ncbi:hypothetical protein CEB3_c29250 [Peptococcaceae bacterium CEB3]|nr:hypothetical protein CEB3_c29250 [Peptococcaceae bacterium CEB3]
MPKSQLLPELQILLGRGFSRDTGPAGMQALPSAGLSQLFFPGQCPEYSHGICANFQTKVWHIPPKQAIYLYCLTC